MPTPPNAGLTTAQLAAQTGLTAGTLRIWESRHGFPAPARLPGGHRRYAAEDVDHVREVLRLREQGLSLSAAIERVQRPPRPQTRSLFSGLRQVRPEIAPTLLPKPAVLALTHAIEDEYCARAADGLLVASFQRDRFYRAAERRWHELARTADLAVALADFPQRADPPGGPVEIPVDHGHPLAREWAVLVSADGVQACLAAWEQPAQERLPDGQRRFEVMWSFDPAVVADAVTVAGELIEPLAADVAGMITARETPAPPPEPALAQGAALAHRMVGYLGRIVPGAG